MTDFILRPVQRGAHTNSLPTGMSGLLYDYVASFGTNGASYDAQVDWAHGNSDMNPEKQTRDQIRKRLWSLRSVLNRRGWLKDISPNVSQAQTLEETNSRKPVAQPKPPDAPDPEGKPEEDEFGDDETPTTPVYSSEADLEKRILEIIQGAPGQHSDIDVADIVFPTSVTFVTRADSSTRDEKDGQVIAIIDRLIERGVISIGKDGTLS